MLLCTIDTETTLNGDPDMGIGHPMHPDNHWVLLGLKWSDMEGVRIWKHSDSTSFDFRPHLKEPDFMVGHNLPFDLLHLYKGSWKTKDSLQACAIWDTQLAEYLLSGQQERWASLDGLSVKYGLPLKEDKIKEYFAAGIGAAAVAVSAAAPWLNL